MIRLLQLQRSPTALGAWVRDCGRELRLYFAGHRSSVLLSGDLGRLLRCCAQVVVREGSQPVVVNTEVLIQWRALQVVTATPHLPGMDRLAELFPGLLSLPTGFQVPLWSASPEEVLAHCVIVGIPVLESRIGYLPPADSDFPSFNRSG